jgi:aryl-alcohol dehydrogenase-like predicted oxidoreductase
VGHDPSHQSFSVWRPVNRRQVLKRIGTLGAALAFGNSWHLAQALSQPRESSIGSEKGTGEIPRRPLGQTGIQVSALALGGWHLGTVKDEQEALRIVHEAIDAGLTFMDNAWDYHKGRSEEVMGKGLKGRRQQAFLMTKVCTHGRDKKVGMRQLEQSLRRLNTDYLDLWQIHEVVCHDDPDLIFAPGGVAEALLEAKQQGKARLIGFTGHKDPSIHLQMLQQNFPFDTCQLPLNVFDWSFHSFERQILPELTRRHIAPIAMKTLCGKAEPIKQKIMTVEEALRYALTLPVATIVNGIDSLEHLRQNLDIVRRFTPMTAQEMDTLRKRVAGHAEDGRFESFKTNAQWTCNRKAVEEELKV